MAGRRRGGRRDQYGTATTTVYVTHDQVEATTMADRVGVMSDGRLEQVGTPAQVYGRPANRFVARFDVRLVEPAGSPLRGTVRLLESLGGETIVVVAVADRLVRALVRTHDQPAEGTPVGLELDPDALHLFEDTGRALR